MSDSALSGDELVELFPEPIMEQADPRRIKSLRKTSGPDEFTEQLKTFAKRCQPIWIFGNPRTGSSWFCKYFMDEFYDVAFNEPFSLVSCSSQNHTKQYLNKGSRREAKRPELQIELGLTDLVSDRLILSVIPRFALKILMDFNIAPQLLELFPQSQFVWMMRDGRDMVESFHNPDEDNWPQAKFSYLGEGEQERYVGALQRFVMFTLGQINFYEEYDQHTTPVTYESFTDDFVGSGSTVLDDLGVSYDRERLLELAEQFDARHGMWQDWKEWKMALFQASLDGDPPGENVNQHLGYGTGQRDASNVWERPSLGVDMAILENLDL